MCITRRGGRWIYPLVGAFPAKEHGGRHLCALVPQHSWYQHSSLSAALPAVGLDMPAPPWPGDWALEACERDCEECPRLRLRLFTRRCRERTCSASREISCFKSAMRASCGGTCAACTVGTGTSMIRSAKSANCSLLRAVLAVDKISCTLAGRRCTNNCFKIPFSNSCYPNNWRILRKSWEGLRSPSSSSVSSICSLRCSDSDVLRINCSLSTSYGRSVGGVSSKSRTSWAISGCRAETTWANLLCCATMRRVVNCASTWANQICGSEAQNGGSLTLLIGASGSAAPSESGFGLAMTRNQARNGIKKIWNICAKASICRA